jgi:hypothetical protein
VLQSSLRKDDHGPTRNHCSGRRKREGSPQMLVARDFLSKARKRRGTNGIRLASPGRANRLMSHSGAYASQLSSQMPPSGCHSWDLERGFTFLVPLCFSTLRLVGPGGRLISDGFSFYSIFWDIAPTFRNRRCTPRPCSLLLNKDLIAKRLLDSSVLQGLVTDGAVVRSLPERFPHK